ncbi:MAG TPA: hypothetical protein VKD72_30695 [Gemmataceae bacterium]|nr:hypothetical protein [Gemmataceae bacterium]
MRSHLVPVACLLVLGIAGSLTLSLIRGQEIKPPVPPAPRPGASVTAPVVAPGPPPLTVTVPGRSASSTRPAIDLARLEPLHRQMYLSARQAADWLSGMNGRKGLFDQGLLPAFGTSLEGDHALRQAGAAFALARAARFLHDDQHAARATHAILSLLEDTVVDPPGSDVRHSVLPSTVVNRLGMAALLVLAIHELPAPSDELLTRADQLCNYIRRQQQPDGSFRLNDTAIPADLDPAAVDQYPGQALYALMRSQKRRPATWKIEMVRKALPYYRKHWHEHKDRDFVCWQSAACAEAYLLTKEKPFADAVLEMNDWLCGLQYEQLDPHHPRWLGGFMACVEGRVTETPPDIGSAACAVSLAEACRIAAQLLPRPDVTRHERYSAALERCLQFLTTLQYAEADTQHFADWYRPRLVGGFYASHQDGTLRIDFTQQALSALVQYLEHVAKVGQPRP